MRITKNQRYHVQNVGVDNIANVTTYDAIIPDRMI